MVKLAQIANQIYREYAPLCATTGLTLDLGLASPLAEVADPAPIRRVLRQYLDFTTGQRRRSGHLILSDQPGTIILKDTSLTLSPEQRQAFASDTVTVRTRVGFGTTLKITY